MLLVKAGALAAVLFLDAQYALDFQLIGGVVIIQILPAVVFGLYTGWFHRWMLWVIPNQPCLTATSVVPSSH